MAVRRPDTVRKASKGVGAHPMLYKMLRKPREVDAVAVVCELPLRDFSKTSTNVVGKKVVDGHAGHAVGWISKPLEIGLGFAFSLGRKLGSMPSFRC